jgi:hypothetical protein
MQAAGYAWGTTITQAIVTGPQGGAFQYNGASCSLNSGSGDGGTQFPVLNGSGGSIISGECIVRAPESSGVYIGLNITPEDFGASAGSSSDQATYLDDAITFAENNPNTCASFGGGPYTVSTMESVATDWTCLIFHNTQFVPYSNGQTILTISASHVLALGSAWVNNSSAGKTGIIPLAFQPANPASSVNSIQNFNTVSMGCWDTTECVAFKPGPRYSGSDSEQYWNNIHFWSRDTLRSVWLANASDNVGGGANDNSISGTIYQTGGTVNVGVQIDEGQHNVFPFLSCNGVNGGTSPLSTPSCIRVAANAAGGQSNSDNDFQDVRAESDTCDINTDTYRLLVKSPAGSTNCGTTFPSVSLGTGGSGSSPVAIPGFAYQGNNQNPAWPSAQSLLTGVDGADVLNGPLTLHDIVQTALCGPGTNGAPGTITNAGTWNFTIPTARATYLVTVTQNINSTLLWTAYITSDGVTNVGAITPNTGSWSSITLSTNALTGTFTNNTGSSGTFACSLLEIGPVP